MPGTLVRDTSRCCLVRLHLHLPPAHTCRPSADPSVVTFGDELLLYVTDNVDTPDRNGRGIGMERCKDEALMENVKRVFGHTEDPQWYRACGYSVHSTVSCRGLTVPSECAGNMRRRSSSHVAYGSFTLC